MPQIQTKPVTIPTKPILIPTKPMQSKGLTLPPKEVVSQETSMMREIATPKFLDYMVRVEGVGAGYNKKKNKYYPYVDVKNVPHIGIGHKILRRENFAKGLTDQEVQRLFASDLESHARKARTYVDAYYGVGKWRRLSTTQKQILLDYSYNPGLGKFPKFTEAIIHENWEKAYMEMTRKVVLRDKNGEVRKVLPLARNKDFYAQFLQPLRENAQRLLQSKLNDAARVAMEDKAPLR